MNYENFKATPRPLQMVRPKLICISRTIVVHQTWLWLEAVYLGKAHQKDTTSSRPPPPIKGVGDPSTNWPRIAILHWEGPFATSKMGSAARPYDTGTKVMVQRHEDFVGLYGSSISGRCASHPSAQAPASARGVNGRNHCALGAIETTPGGTGEQALQTRGGWA